MKITIKQLEVLQAVILAGGISDARRTLGLSQPTISQQLSKMEAALDTQLIRRTRSSGVDLTQAGEFWFRLAEDVLGRLSEAENHHKGNFNSRQVELRFGTTPSLRGHFLRKAALTSLSIGQFSNVEFVWGANSSELVGMINTRRINCGVVTTASVEQYKSSLHIRKLFDDEVVWVVPRSIPEAMIAKTLNDGLVADEPYDALNRYVDVNNGVPWHSHSENWFRSELPHAAPYFTCMTHQAAVDIVSGGLATCHSPMSLLPNTPIEVLSRIKCYRSPIHVRNVALVMPKHLLTLQPFNEFAEILSTFFEESYMDGVSLEEIPRFKL